MFIKKDEEFPSPLGEQGISTDQVKTFKAMAFEEVSVPSRGTGNINFVKYIADARALLYAFPSPLGEQGISTKRLRTLKIK